MVFNKTKKTIEKSLHKNSERFKRIIEKNTQIKNQDSRRKIINPPYYNLTEKAENYILLKQYSKAKETYFQLVSENKVVFARDISNAIRCAILARDYKLTFEWSEKLAQKGMELSYFNSKIFNSFRKSSNWNAFRVKYDSICKISQSLWNINLKNQLNNLLNEDQNNYGLLNRKEPQILYETTEKITNKLITLLEKEGFPSEERIGVFTNNDTILLEEGKYNVIIRHAVQQKPNEIERLMELLNKAQESLEYDKERSSNHKNFPSSCYQIYRGNLYKDKSCSNRKIIEVKIKFKFNNPYGFIIDYGDFIVSEYNKENPQEYDKYYEENFNFVMKLTDDWEFYEK